MKIKTLNKKIKQLLEVARISALNHAFLQQKELQTYEKKNKKSEEGLFELTQVFSDKYKNILIGISEKKFDELFATEIKIISKKNNIDFSNEKLEKLKSSLIRTLKIDFNQSDKEVKGKWNSFTHPDGSSGSEYFA